MPTCPKLDAAAITANMAEIHPPLNPAAAVAEAHRCLFCFDAPCIRACPTGIDIPAFIRKITTGNLAGAGRTILSANILGASCARVCPTAVLCEGACVLHSRGEAPVEIGRLQRHATDYVFEHQLQVLPPAATATGFRVAVLGGGPAGLGCAAELAQLGHGVTVFEKRPHAGGLNTHGIAYYKMKPDVSLAEVEMVARLGVEFRRGVEVGRDIPMADLERDYAALFLGFGLGGGRRLGIPGEDLPGVVEAVDWIEQLHTRPLETVPVGNRVAVIGGGNTALDAVNQARRLGARQVVVIYRRGVGDLPAYEFERELALRGGAEFLFYTTPVAVLADAAGQVCGIRLAATRVERTGEPEPDLNTAQVMPVDMVIKAVGQEKPGAALRQLLPDLALNPDGTVRHDATTGQTNLPRVFTGGDCANGGREVVNAVAEGKRAARGIHALLTGQAVTGPLQSSRAGVAGNPWGAGFDQPVRVPGLGRKLATREGAHGGSIR